MELAYLLIGVYAGFAGSLLGIGGGIIVVPALTAVFGVPIHNAVATSLVSNTAVSILSVVRKTDAGLVNVPLALLMSVTTVVGVLFGVRAGKMMPPYILEFCFLAFALFMAGFLIYKNFILPKAASLNQSGEFSLFTQTYADAGKQISYTPVKLGASVFLSVFAGIASGVLGVGGGVLQIPVLNAVSKVPMKPAGGTCNLIIAITSGAAAMAYYRSGHTLIEPAAHLVLWLCAGVWLGTKVLDKINEKALIVVFVFVLLAITAKMVLK